jgi:hypothetical protein
MTRSRDLANLADGTEFTAADHTKLDGIATSANNYVHPNHSGEVTSTADGATVIVDDIVDEANLKVSNTPTNGYFLSAQSGNTGGMTWAEVAQPSASDTLNTIKTVDGTGSGLDADLLDGQEGAYYAPIGSPTLTGTPAAPTASAGANSTQISTTAYVDSAISALADSAPAALNTLNELAAALGDDANYAATTTTAIGTKLAKAGGQMTGNITMSGTETVDGRDLSVDGAKLDTIETSATADQTAAQILTAIKTVDGTGSGLDADQVDGVDASSFLRSDQRDSGVGLDINGGTNNGANDATFYIGASNNNDWGLLINANSGKTEYGAKIDMPASYAYALQIRNNGTESFRIHDSGLTMTGNLTLGGTVDGRDVAADGTKLDTIATSANNYSFPYTVSDAAGNSTVVQRTNAGYIFANYLNTTNADMGSTAPTKVYVSGDNYLRHVDVASFKAFMNVTAKTGYLGRESYTSDANYWVGSMGNNNVSFDNLFLYGSGFTDNWSSPSGQPSGATHWQGLQALHYSTGAIAATYGFQMTVGQGNPALCYLRGRWASTSNGWVKMWNAGNDGSGSGLDADLLDGLDSGSFLRSDTGDTASGDITFNGGAGAVTIGANGDIRSSSNNWSGESHGKMQYHSNNWYIQYYSNMIHRDSAGNNRMTLDSSGNVTFASNVTAYSDIRLKENIKTIENAVDLVGQMRGVFYTEKKTKNARVGVIAQEIEKVLPEVVRDNEQYNPDTGKTEDSIKSVDYGNIVGVLVEAIKELKEEIEELKNGSNI